MPMPECHTKIVATIGPASDDVGVLCRMMEAGMDIARLNFSHGTFDEHARRIECVRQAAREAGRHVVLMADLPGPKIRLGILEPDVITLSKGARFTLTTRSVVGGAELASVTFPRLPEVVHPGDLLFLNDGLVQLRVERIEGMDVQCRVEVGGELRSRKGVNFPGISLGISAFTERDREVLGFALKHGVDAVSQSFVETACDVETVRKAARELGYCPFVIAKIERAAALRHVDEVLRAADGIMVARGDLGVEIPIEEIALTQKDLVRAANRMGRPVIAATQLLESMTYSRLPTRAEATDVANAVLDGADCLMLSGESAIGQFPVESVSMLARIAARIEAIRPATPFLDAEPAGDCAEPALCDLVAASIHAMVERFEPAAIIVPSRTGATARGIARFRPRPWIIAVTQSAATFNALQFTAGVYPLIESETVTDWTAYVRQKIRRELVAGDLFLVVTGPSPERPEASIRIEVLDLRNARQLSPAAVSVAL